MKITTLTLLAGLTLGGAAMAQDTMDKAQGMGQDAVDTTKQAGQDAVDTTKQAGQDAKDMGQGAYDKATGGSGQATMPSTDPNMQGTQAMTGTTKEMTAKVLGMSSDNIILEGDNGAAIPVKVTHETQIAGKRLKKDERIESHLKKDFKAGDEVRASFDVRMHKDGKVENVATSVDKK